MNPPLLYMSSQSGTPLPPPTPHHLSGSSLCTSPKHPVSCIEHRLVIHFLHDSIHVSMPFFQIIPPYPSPSESKSPFYMSVSLMLSHIQGFHCATWEALYVFDKHPNKGISPIKQTEDIVLPQGSCVTQMHLTSIHQAYST